MFTKTSLQNLFQKNKGKNFIITTNVAHGQGINGVSFKTYCGKKEWSKIEYGDKTFYHDNNKIIDFTDEYIILENDIFTKNEWKDGVFEYYIPYDSINSVSFVKESKRLDSRL